MEVTSIRSEIIHVCFNKVKNKFNKNTQNFPLESSTSIAHTKWKNSIGKGTPRTCKCGFILVFRADLDLVVSIKSIQEGEEFIPYKANQNLVNEGKSKMVLLCSLVKFPVINKDSPKKKTRGDTHSLSEMGYMNTVSNSFCNSSSIMSLRVGFILLWCWHIGLHPSLM